MMKRKKRSSSSNQALLILFVGALLCSYVGLFGLHRRVVLTDSLPSPSNIGNGNGNTPLIEAAATTTYVKPKLSDYIQGWNITGNVNWLLDFAVVGFPKAGTSTLMLYLQKQHKSIFMFDQERCEMGYNQQVPLLVDLYKNYQGPHLKMGIKCPRDLEVSLALANYRTFFPKTKFVVGLRHPILWFQSFYNFRITNDYPMPPPQRLIGRCKRAHQGVCTFRANFSNHLQQIEPLRKVFVYHVDQLQQQQDGNNTTRATRFRRDLQTFLELSEPLDDPMMWVQPGRPPASPQRAQELKRLKINICDESYNELRRILLEHASHSATWMQTVWFAQSQQTTTTTGTGTGTTPTIYNNVHVSSPGYFHQLLNKWHVDPCDNHNNMTT
jgi:hypothetical protein